MAAAFAAFRHAVAARLCAAADRPGEAQGGQPSPPARQQGAYECAQAADRKLRRPAGRDEYPAGCTQSDCADKAEGRRLVLATAHTGSTPMQSPSGSGFDDVIGTGSIIGLDERVHARIGGENAYGDARCGRSPTGWRFRPQGFDRHVRFDRDHVSDQPAFEWSDQLVAVKLDGQLRRLAKERGWTVEDWGEGSIAGNGPASRATSRRAGISPARCDTARGLDPASSGELHETSIALGALPRRAAPIPPNPRSIRAHLAGSGTAPGAGS